MTPTGVLLGATRPAGWLCSRVLHWCQAIRAELCDQKPPVKNLRLSSVGLFGLALAVFATAPPAGAQPLTGRARVEAVRDSRIAVPGVVGMTEVAAEQALRDSGFGVQSFDTTVSQRKEFGRVVSSEPVAGQMLLPGQTVLLWTGRRPPAGAWLAALILLLGLGALAAGLFLLRRRVSRLVGWFTQVVQRVPVTTPPPEVPGLTDADVDDLKSLLPTLKLDRGVITRIEEEMFELRAEVRKLAEQLKPSSVAAEEPDRSREVIRAYNEAIESASPTGFLERLKPISVALSGRHVVDAGVAPLLEFTESEAGSFLLVQDKDRWLLFPKQGTAAAQLGDIEQCYVVEHGSQEPANKNLVQFVRRAALCVPAEKGWVLKQKGHLFIHGLPETDELT